MSERIETLKHEVSTARQYLNAVLDQVGDRWDTPVYSDGARWNVRQLVVHLSIADHGLNNQIMNIAEGREVIPEDFDLERYNQRSVEKRAEMTVEEALANLDASRKALIEWLDSVDEAKLERTGRHASLRILSVEELVHVVADHDRGHASDIARALGIEAVDRP